jgi:hypothetical protein
MHLQISIVTVIPLEVTDGLDAKTTLTLPRMIICLQPSAKHCVGLALLDVRSLF